MKSNKGFAFLFVSILLLLIISSTHLRKVKSHRGGHDEVAHLKNKLVFRMLSSYLLEFKWGPHVLNTCSNRWNEWIKLSHEEERNPTPFIPSSSKFEKIVSYLGEHMTLLCIIKDKLTDFFLKEEKKQRRRHLRRVFMHKRMQWSVSKFIDTHNAYIFKLAKSIQKGKAKGYVPHPVINKVNWLKAPLHRLHAFLKSTLINKFQPLFFEFTNLKKEITVLIVKHPLMIVIKQFLKCMINKKVAKGHALSLMHHFMKMERDVATGKDFTKFVINAICGWSDLVEAVPILKQAEETKDIHNRYMLYGKFLAHFLMAIIG